MAASFASIQFGYADAHKEGSEEPDLLIDGFLDDARVMDSALRGSPFLFLGYKGCGKTAIVERAKLLAERDPQLFVTAATLEEFSYTDFKTFAGVSGDFQSRYPAAWAWSLLLLLIQSFEADESARLEAQRPYTKAVTGLRELDLMPVPQLNQLVSRSSKRGFKAGIPKFLEVNEERVYEGQDLQLSQMVAVLRAAVKSFRTDSTHVVFVDGLDDVLTTRELQFQAIAALITEVSRLNGELRVAGCPAKFVVLCRTDIFDRLPGANKNKIRQDSSVELDWYHDPRDPAGSRLHTLVNLRASVSLGREVDVFQELLPRMVDGRPAVRYLLDHTRHTPRDVLQLMRAIQGFVEHDGPVTEREIRSGLRTYSTRYFLPELRDELHGYAEPTQIDSVVALLTSLERDRFSLDELHAQLELLGFPPIDLPALVRTLFECGGLGMIEEQHSGAPHYTFKYRNRHAIPIPTRRWVIHMGALKALNIERPRRPTRRGGRGR
ncbi:hypothetical protein OJ997_09235 [Solirubrobacter phytolaccae]|uniref:Orc1-like AAA ATPase domain-containing protein n=1 Tax=Solirubrobacter phytolaccae TaxID=1404360 RepID=A0A9X3N5X6_9ACTN|nr:hypothetical protein [Solirubrobacter phytolaccae]MDA0180475.1 hypothetical protein [Solirubrobacter phytolaccae]